MAFKEERNGHDTDGEDALVASDFRHHRSRTRTGAATHTCGDKHHLGVVVEECADVVGAFKGGLLCHLWLIAGAQAVGGLRADEQTLRHWRIVECLAVGVEHHKRNAVHVLGVHVVDGVAATATHAHYLDDGGQCERAGFPHG